MTNLEKAQNAKKSWKVLGFDCPLLGVEMTLDELYNKAETKGGFWESIKNEIYESAINSLRLEGLTLSPNNVIERQEAILCAK